MKKMFSKICLLAMFLALTLVVFAAIDTGQAEATTVKTTQPTLEQCFLPEGSVIASNFVAETVDAYTSTAVSKETTTALSSTKDVDLISGDIIQAISQNNSFTGRSIDTEAVTNKNWMSTLPSKSVAFWANDTGQITYSTVVSVSSKTIPGEITENTSKLMSEGEVLLCYNMEMVSNNTTDVQVMAKESMAGTTSIIETSLKV